MYIVHRVIHVHCTLRYAGGYTVWTTCTEIILLLWWLVKSSVHVIDCSDACIPTVFLCFFAAFQREHSKGDEFDVIHLVFV